VPGAEHTSCTVEMVAMQRRVDVAVIDEIQMIGDEARGWAWTRALMGVPANEVHLCGDGSGGRAGQMRERGGAKEQLWPRSGGCHRQDGTESLGMRARVVPLRHGLDKLCCHVPAEVPTALHAPFPRSAAPRAAHL
jgi:hypothetical protein